MIKLFDAHCHLQDPKIINKAPNLIKAALENGVLHFAVNGVSEKDWHLVKEMSNNHPSIIPSFGIHPWFITDKTSNWMTNLREFMDSTPSAAIGEIGLDKGSRGKTIDFTNQVETFRLQLELAKELKRPASVHCVRAYGDLLDIMKSIGPFPEGVILHSYLGSAEMVPEFAKLGAYFSFSGFLMSMKESKAKKMVKAVPSDRILLETDAPDAVPKVLENLETVFLVEEEEGNEGINHPANILFVLSYVARLLDMSKEEVADVSYRNAMRIFSYKGSKVEQVDFMGRMCKVSTDEGIIFSTFTIGNMPKKSSSKTSKPGLQNPALATWEKPKKTISKPPKKSPLPKEKPSSTPNSFGQEIEDIFSKKTKKPEPQKTKKGKEGKLDKEKGKDGKYDETLDRKKLRNKPGGSNVEMFEKEENARPKRKTGDGLLIYSEEELGIGKADAGGTRLCPFDCDCCF